jgi:LysR family glycine cleavage system transcriptional activator
MRMPGHLPPLNALRAFEAAARHMSFSRAAAELNVTPAAISHQIRALEDDLGVRLFRRLNRSLELTESARQLLPDLADAFERIRAGVGRLRRHNETGTLTVTTAPSLAAKWLVLRLHRFAERHPEIDVRVTASDGIVDLAAGEIDMAIRYGAGRYPGLAVELLLANEVFPVCSPQLVEDGPKLRCPADLGRHALLHDLAGEIDPLAPTWTMWLKAAGVPAEIADHGVRFSNTYLALDAAIAGRGVALANTTIAAADLAAGRLVRPLALGVPDHFSYWIVTAPGALERRKVRLFRDWLRTEADGRTSG